MIDRSAAARHPPPSFLLANLPVAEVSRLAAFAEAAGTRRAWLAETNTAELASMAGALAASTGLELGSAIMSVFTRTPVVAAMLAATVSRLSGRPFHLGVGAGGQAIVERWSGMEYRRTVERTRDFLAIARTVLEGRRTEYEGKVLSSHGFVLDPPPDSAVPIYLGAIGPRMTALAASEADGVILTWASPEMVRSQVDSLRGLVAESGRHSAGFRIVGRMYAAVTADVEAVREAVRHELVGYLASPPYARYFSQHGFGEEARAVAHAFGRGDRTGSLRAVSDRLLDELVTVGSARDAHRQAEAYWAAGVDDLMVQTVPAAGIAGAEETITAVL